MRATSVLASVVVSVFITPTFSSEPVDLPKMFVLVLFSGIASGFLVNNFRNFIRLDRKIPVILLTLFLADLIFILFSSGAPFGQQFFGTFGRNTGFLTYFTLVIIFSISVLCSDAKLVRQLFWALFVTGAASFVYGLLQYFKHDPIKWNNPYAPIIAFLGNPDFASSFLAMSAITIMALFFKGDVRIWARLLLLTYGALTLLLIIKTRAQQGGIVYFLGLILVFYFYLLKNSKIKNYIAQLFLVLMALPAIAVIMGIFNNGPLSSLHKVSVRQRGFYWHAALNMMNSNPITGVGLDSYGDNYFTYRSKNAAFHSLLTQSNSAHNVFLDIGSNGGWVLFLLYVLLVLYIFWRGITVIRNMERFDPFYIALFVSWIGYQAQSFVSINQIGLAIWGWSLGGAVVGFSFTRRDEDSEKKNHKRGKAKKKSNTYLAPTFGLLISSLIAFPPFLADHNYRNALVTRDVNKVIQATQAYPEDLGRTSNTAQILQSNKLNKEALDLSKHIVTLNPKAYNAWNVIFQLADPKSSDYSNARAKLKFLNPFDATIK
jgi:O-antigen ligase